MTNEILISINGKVQGVSFRYRAQEKALELGLTGWIKNEPDGSVSICAQGDEAVLKNFLDWCNIGPRRAEITNITASPPKNQQEPFPTFEIRY